MSYETVLYFAVKILIALAQTSEMPYHFRQLRVAKLEEIMKELVKYHD